MRPYESGASGALTPPAPVTQPGQSAKTDSGVSYSSPKTAHRRVPRTKSARVLIALMPWAACFCGVFGVLVISTHLATGIAAIMACATLLMVPRGVR